MKGLNGAFMKYTTEIQWICFLRNKHKAILFRVIKSARVTKNIFYYILGKTRRSKFKVNLNCWGRTNHNSANWGRSCREQGTLFLYQLQSWLRQEPSCAERQVQPFNHLQHHLDHLPEQTALRSLVSATLHYLSKTPGEVGLHCQRCDPFYWTQV